MAWFDRHRGQQDAREAYDALTRALGRSGIEPVLERTCGPAGLRRFLVRFEETPRGFRVTSIESEPVKGGGGPPPQLTANAAVPDLERAIRALRAELPAPFGFERGAIGVVRDSEGPLDLAVRLDEDGDALRLADLRAPRGPGVPVDDPAYLQALGTWSERANRVRSGWKMPGKRQSFHIEGNRLTLGGDGADESLIVTLLGTWDGRHDRFTWLVDKPVADEAPFVHAEQVLTLAQVTELVAFAAARLGAIGVFQGSSDTDGVTVFAAIRS